MLQFFKTNLTNPLFQAISIIVLMTCFMVVSMITKGFVELNPTGPWEIMAAFILFYTLVNCVFSLQSKDIMIYFRNSIFCFLGILLIGGLISYGFSRVAIHEAGSIKWILMVFSIGYLVFLSIVNLMRYIVELAQKQDSRLRGEDPS